MRRKGARKPDAGHEPLAAPKAARKPARTYQLKTPLIAVSLVFLVLIAYGGICTRDSRFIDWDDDEYVLTNSHVRGGADGRGGGLSAENVRWAFVAFHSNNWHPLTWLSLQLDYELFGLESWGYHQTNVILHAAATLVLFLVLHSMTGAVWRSALVAALFAIHPLHVESVAWVAERKDVLSGLFWMLTLWAYGWYARGPSWQRYVLLLAAFAGGLMAKPMLVTLPFVLLLLDYWPLRRIAVGISVGPASVPAGTEAGRDACPTLAIGPTVTPSIGRLLLEKVPLLTLAIGCSILTLHAQEHVKHSLADFPVHVRILNALLSYVRYLFHMIWPVDLAAFYPHWQERFPVWLGIVSGVAVLAVSVLVLRQRRERPYLAVGWIWYLGTLVPVLGLVQVGMQALADRYTYIPLVGIFIILAWGGAELAAKWKLTQALQAGIAGAALLACLVLTWNQVLHWRNTILLWGRAVVVTKDNWVAHYNLGVALRRQRLLDEAVHHLQRSAQIEPRHPDTHYQLGLSLVALGRNSEAAEALQAAIAQRADYTLAHFTLGQMRLADGRLTEAVEQFRECVRIHPESVEANAQLGTALLYQGKHIEARPCLEAVLRSSPNHAGAHADLGLLFALEGDWPRAREHLEQAGTAVAETQFTLAWILQTEGKQAAAKSQYAKALALDRAWPLAAARQAWVLATNAEPRHRNGKLAVQRGQAACAATNHGEFALLDALAAALAEAGRFAEAKETAQRALDLAKGREAAAAIERRLRLYEGGQAFHEADSHQPTKEWSYRAVEKVEGVRAQPR
jgi:tetratricopeptide (TPR) repeat protein